MGSVYEIVTDKIIKELENGTVPWHKPWNGAISRSTGKEYRGINRLLLDAGEYATYKQIEAEGGQVKKGSKGHLVTFWKMNKFEEESGEEKTIPMLRYYTVFEIGSQVDGLEYKYYNPKGNFIPEAQAENIIENWAKVVPINYGGSQAYYSPSSDEITLPEKEKFLSTEEYYSTAYHEAIHSTGHDSRLKRFSSNSIASFGSETYSKEELVAEIGAAYLCNIAGVETVDTLKNNASYIQSWLNVLKNDKRMIISAASQSEKAVQLIMNIQEGETV